MAHSDSSSSISSAYTSVTSQHTSSSASFEESSERSSRLNGCSSSSMSSSSSSNYTMTDSHLASMKRDARERAYNYSDSEDTDTGGTEQSLNESFTSLQVSVVLLYCCNMLCNTCLVCSVIASIARHPSVCCAVCVYMHCTIAASMLPF
jgi:hypothetical protein